MNLLVIEDDQALGKAIQRGLVEACHRCQWVRSGKRGLDEAQSQQFDAIVLDLMLPDLDGMAIMKSLRDKGIPTPVLILTAMSAVEDRVSGEFSARFHRELQERSSPADALRQTQLALKAAGVPTEAWSSVVLVAGSELFR